MKVAVAKSSGFCFGVRRAIDMGLNLAGKKERVRVLGDIVHNSFVVKKLSEKGVKKIKNIRPVLRKTVLIISAHGAPEKIFKKASFCGYKIADATCPKVKAIYQIARRLERDNELIIIGDKGHTEVKGIAGQLKKRPTIIESVGKIPLKKTAKMRKAAVVTQSTQSRENVSAIFKELRKIIPEISLHDTTCSITSVKQNEIKKMSRANDVILIVGSPTSANTKRLFLIAKEINKKTFWIESGENIRKEWFFGVKKVGIMAGASTPDEIVGKIVERVKNCEQIN